MSTILTIFAFAMTGDIQGGFACLGAAIGVGIVGGIAADSTGRNPHQFSKIMILAVLGMALSEAVAFYGLFL